jgi:hypothetical protein
MRAIEYGIGRGERRKLADLLAELALLAETQGGDDTQARFVTVHYGGVNPLYCRGTVNAVKRLGYPVDIVSERCTAHVYCVPCDPKSPA